MSALGRCDEASARESKRAPKSVTSGSMHASRGRLGGVVFVRGLERTYVEAPYRGGGYRYKSSMKKELAEER